MKRLKLNQTGLAAALVGVAVLFCVGILGSSQCDRPSQPSVVVMIDTVAAKPDSTKTKPRKKRSHKPKQSAPRARDYRGERVD